MKVHFMMPGDIHALTGGYIYNKNVAKGLEDRGHEVFIHELGDSFPFPDDNTFARCREVFDTTIEGEPVVVDSLALGPLLPVLLDYYGKNPIVALMHMPQACNQDLSIKHREFLGQLEKSVLSMSSAIIVTSVYTQKIISDWLRYPSIIQVIQPGVEVTKRKFYWPAYPKKLLCVSNYLPNKGQYLLVKALVQLKDLNWQLQCYGNKEYNPRYTNSLASVVEKYNLQDRVRLSGPLAGAALEEAYLSSDLLVSSSYFETYGMVLAEALAHGIPVVASTGGGIRDTVPTSMGLFFKPGDIFELQTVIRSILTDSWLYQRLCAETAGYYKRVTTWQDTVEKFEKVLKEVIGE